MRALDGISTKVLTERLRMLEAEGIVQDLRLLRHNIRYLLAEYVTTEGRTITGKLPAQQQGHYGVTLRAEVLYQHHQCRVPQPLIVEQLREFGIEISAGQVNRLLMEEKASFHTERAVSVASGFRDS